MGLLVAVLIASGYMVKGPGAPQQISLLVILVGIPCISDLDFCKSAPCRGLVKWSAKISSVGNDSSLFLPRKYNP